MSFKASLVLGATLARTLSGSDNRWIPEVDNCPFRFGRFPFPVVPFHRFTVLALRLFFSVSRFQLCCFSQHIVSETQFSLSRAAVRPISLLRLSLLRLLDSDFPDQTDITNTIIETSTQTTNYIGEHYLNNDKIATVIHFRWA